jgi:hypothetical protein
MRGFETGFEVLSVFNMEDWDGIQKLKLYEIEYFEAVKL